MLASGSGTILHAILEAGIPVAAVIVDRPCEATEVAAQWDRIASRFSLARSSIEAIWPLVGTRTEAILATAST